MSHSESMPMCCAARESLNKSGEARDDALMTLDKVAALTRTKLFAALDANGLRLLAERAVERRFRKDEVLFVAGDEAHGLYVIVEGAVRAFRVSLDGRE